MCLCVVWCVVVSICVGVCLLQCACVCCGEGFILVCVVHVFLPVCVCVCMYVCVCVCYEWCCCVCLYVCCCVIDSMNVTPLNQPEIQTFKPTFQQPTIYHRKHHILPQNTPHSTTYPRTSNPTYLRHDEPELISLALD